MVSDGASVASCCIIHGYSRNFIAGDRIVFKPVDMFPCCTGYEFQSNPKAGSMGGVPGQSGYGHHLRFRFPERISLGIKQKREPARTTKPTPIARFRTKVQILTKIIVL